MEWRVSLAISVALLGPLQYGVTLTLLNTMLETLSEDLGFDQNVGGAVASAALHLGSILGCLTSSPFERLTGRYAQPYIGVLFTMGALLGAFTTENKVCWDGAFDGCVAKMLLAGRLVSGFATGLARVVAPKYIARVSPPHIRGALCSLPQLFIASGIFTGLVIGMPYEYDGESRIGIQWWRIMFLLSAIPAVLQVLLGMLSLWAGIPLPSTEIQTLEMSHSMKTHELPRRKPAEGVVEEPQSREAAVRDLESRVMSEKQNGQPSTLKGSLMLCFQQRYRRSVILGIGVPAVGQLSGINVISGYSTIIFKDAGFDKPIIGSAIYGFVDIVGSLVAVAVFDRAGRTTMAYISFSGMALSYLGAALTDLSSSSVSSWMAVVFVLSFVFFFGAGCGSLLLAYAPEVVPPEIAGIVLGTGQAVAIIISLILVLVFPSVLDAIGVLGAFLILCFFCVASLLFLITFMVETKGKELKDIIKEIQK